MTDKPTIPFNRIAPAKDQDYRRVLEDLAHTRTSIVGVFSDFCRIAACCVAAQTREDEYMTAIAPYSREDLTAFGKALAFLIEEMEQNPFADILGTHYTDIVSPSSRDSRGEFFTPPGVTKLLADLSFDAKAVIAAGKPVTVCDPAAGSGGMILACAEALAPQVGLLRATLQDINPVACDMSYINMTLWGVPAEVIQGNTLTMKLDHRWTNIHWAMAGEETRRMVQRMTAVLTPNDRPQAPSPAPSDPATEQQEFDFLL